MGSSNKLRLGHVEGEDAVRLRETMNVEGISVEDMTRRVVKSYLSQQTALDEARQRTVDIAGETLPYRYVEGLGMCLICDGKPVTIEAFAGMIADEVKKWRFSEG